MRREIFTDARAVPLRGTGGEPPVRVLLVDDDEEDLFLTRSLLRQVTDRVFTVTTASTAEEALTRMGNDDAWDVCLLDYRLRQNNGLELLCQARSRGFTAPVVLLTGLSDSDVDHAAAEAGASDYLVKGQIAPADLERSIRFAIAQKRAEEALRKQTAFVSAVLDTAGALVVVLDKDDTIIRFNRACEQVTGYSFAELAGSCIWDLLVPPQERESVREVFHSLTAGGGARSHEHDWLTRSGVRRRIAWSITSLCDRRGQIEYFVATGIDVTERREAEEALAIARAREVEAGASIQKALLVREPPTGLPGVRIAAHSVPSQHIGGDYYDFFVLERDVVDVIVGDVMGKGIQAALLAAATKSHFQRTVRRLETASARFGRHLRPEEVVSAVHHQLSPELWTLRSCVTLAYARFDMCRRVLSLVDCGSPHPIHFRASDQTCTLLRGADSLPLGIDIGERYPQVEIPFSPGDLFLFYSDGVTESCDSISEELLGEDRLMALVRDAAAGGADPDALIKRVAEAADDFGGGGVQDDLTCVAVKIEHWEAQRRMAYKAREFASDPDNLMPFRVWVADFLTALPHPALDETAIFLVEAALAEAAGNIIRHAYRGESGRPIQVEIEAYEAELRVVFRDWGAETLEMSAIPEPAFDGSRDSGFGWFILWQCFDEVRYSRDELGRNCLILFKKLEANRANTADDDDFDGDYSDGDYSDGDGFDRKKEQGRT